ncbi:hypothetical protein Acid345_2256 [Candidatus Koribacter versatilis Ellin345]|uniref:Bacterial Ig-like domain-containing protein n=1 Tax=Koribacter versatilis (strain Ellin345) TaxID=204669 RepID=Q1IPE3_KORVE|nr:hypothetical protein [Candidatus Koribacter versatilis]ABF41257.1 hypothetical protein Acid345_2256 [Candidatus Koribacter versatilis Ellin345]
MQLRIPLAAVAAVMLVATGLAQTNTATVPQSPTVRIVPTSSDTYPFYEPCPSPTTDRTINICTPPDGVDLTGHFLLRAKVADSAGLKGIALYQNGTFVGSAESIPPDVSIFLFDGSPNETLRLTLQAKDAQGYFQKTVTLHVTNAPPCTPSATDLTMTICTPVTGEPTWSPVHISGVATDSADQAGNQQVATTVYVDGVNATYARATNVVNSWILMNPGKHRVTIQHHDQAGHTFQKTEYVTVQ